MIRTVRNLLLAGLVCGLALVPAGAAAQEPDIDDLRDEIEALREGQAQIVRELAEIKRLVQARPAAPARPAGPDVAGKVFELGENPAKGERTAKLTLVEFADYQ